MKVFGVCFFVVLFFGFTLIAHSELVLVNSADVPFTAGVAVNDGNVLVPQLDANSVSAIPWDGKSSLGTPTQVAIGSGPRAIAMARKGQYAVIVESGGDSMVVLDVSGPAPREVRRVLTGGDNPFDVAVAFDDLVVIANRDADQVALFSIDRRGNMRQVGTSFPTGIDPHVIAVSPQGVVAVANNSSNDLSLFITDRKGNMFLVDAAFEVPNSPQAVAFDKHGKSMFVGTRSSQAGVEDQIQGYVDNGGANRGFAFTPTVSVPAGIFLTDLEVSGNRLFAVTVNTSLKDELRSYVIKKDELILEFTLELPSTTPSFKRLAVVKGHGKVKHHIFVSEYQSGFVRLIERR